MRRMLLAELAIFIEFQPIWMVLLVLIGLVISVLANRAGQRNGVTHFMHSSLTDFATCQKVTHVLYHTCYIVSTKTPVERDFRARFFPPLPTGYDLTKKPRNGGFIVTLVAEGRFELSTLRV